MYNSIVNFIVEKYLSSIIEVDPKEINANLASGHIEMSHLSLHQEFFDTVNFPYIEVVQSYIGNMSIDIEMPRFYLAPIKITIDKIFIQARQKNLSKITLNNEIEAMEDFKNSKLQNLEEFVRKITDLHKQATNVVELILNNIEININEIKVQKYLLARFIKNENL